MAATFFLVRHASFDGLGEELVGRAEGFHLNSKGKQEATNLAHRFASVRIAAVHSSPRARAQETAQAIAGRAGLSVQIDADLDEIDYGEWTGKAFRDLDGDFQWRQFNVFRSISKIPHGESMVGVAQRAIELLDRQRRTYEGKSAVLVTHADWIRAALAHYSGICLDLMQRLEISTASISILKLDDGGPKILRMNDTGPLQQ
jgi:broad specificity phosphatase PhoE